MKKLDKFYNIAIGGVVLAIIAVVVFRFIINKMHKDSFHIQGFENIIVTDLSGSEIALTQLMAKAEPTYCIILRFTDCNSCIVDAIEDLKRLKNAGKVCIGLVIHDLIDEVRGWSAHYEFIPFFMLKTVDFYEYIHSPLTPVLVKFEKQKTKSWKYFSPH